MPPLPAMCLTVCMLAFLPAARPTGAEAEEEAAGTPDGAGQCGGALACPEDPAVGGAGAARGVLPQRQQWRHLPRYGLSKRSENPSRIHNATCWVTVL